MKKGIESFRAAVMKDCQKGENCFNENGCDHECKCTHRYCDKYKWVIDRAKHYADKTNSTMEAILEAWEENRSYWYMNYYQDAKQPEIKGGNVIMYEDWLKEIKSRFGDKPENWAFKCPACGHIQTGKDFLDNGIKDGHPYYNCIGRYKKGVGCDWTLGGLFQIHKTTVIKDGSPFPVFEMAEKEVTA